MVKRKITQKLSRLGNLETEIMAVVWKNGKATVREVYTALWPRRALAYTTVMTVMTRLARKNVLKRKKEGRAFYYSSVTPQEKVTGALLKSLVARLYGGATGQAVTQLLEMDTHMEDAELERLEALIRAKRKALRP